MIKALLIRKGLTLAITLASTSVIPWLIYDKPRIQWAWDKLGPRVVETATGYVETGEFDFDFRLPGVKIDLPAGK